MSLPIRSTPRGDVLPADLPLARAIERLAGDPRAVWPLSVHGGVLGVDPVELRFAAQRGQTGTLADFTDPELTAPDEGTARAWLDEDATRSGVLAGEMLVARDVPAVRQAIVMAGGIGSRLRPLTDSTPKPLLEVGGRVLLFRIFDRLEAHGVERVLVSINHLGDQVRAAVGDASSWGFEIEFLEEDEPLDTGAGLALHPGTDEPFFVLNGDILTTLDLGALGRWHRLQGRIATVATVRYAAPLPYGVVHHDGAKILDIEEKPVYRYDINAGVYVFSPHALERVTPRAPLAMVDFLNGLCRAGDLVGGFPIVEYWNDVGTHPDFERAQTDVEELGL